MNFVRPALALLFLGTAGCAATTGGPAAPDGAASAAAVLRDASGRTVATASLRDNAGAIHVHVEAAGLAAGTYGAHIHAVGLCEAPAFTTAGAHWNPAGRQHGTSNPQGPHKGDLPNLVVDASGRGSIEYVVEGASLGGATALLDADGAAVVVHAQPDDYRTDPSGNSGARIACGVVGRG
jgi:Cu-Zn family superoxide dismutase